MDYHLQKHGLPSAKICYHQPNNGMQSEKKTQEAISQQKQV